MELGPFKTKLKYIDVDIDGIDLIDLPGSEDDFIRLLRVDMALADTSERSVTGVDLDLVWRIEIKTDSGGIWAMSPSVEVIEGTIVIEDLPQNPLEDINDDTELEEFEVSFTSEGYEIEVNNPSEFSLSERIQPGTMTINIKNKKIIVEF